MKKFNPASAIITAVLITLAGCQERESTADLDRILGVASDSFNSFESSEANINEENAMDVFAQDYANNLNSVQPLAYSEGTVGVQAQSDGSFAGFHDANNNQIKDAGEKDLFNLEIDAENQRLLASDGEAVHEQPYSGGMGNGFLMGMLLGNMLSRQSVAGVRPSTRTAKPRASRSSFFNSARKRSGSGSHSLGK